MYGRYVCGLLCISGYRNSAKEINNLCKYVFDFVADCISRRVLIGVRFVLFDIWIMLIKLYNVEYLYVISSEYSKVRPSGL